MVACFVDVDRRRRGVFFCLCRIGHRVNVFLSLEAVVALKTSFPSRWLVTECICLDGQHSSAILGRRWQPPGVLAVDAPEPKSHKLRFGSEGLKGRIASIQIVD